ncbi:MAG: hypothetical protein M0032_11180 [Actinomycetota bacterium]|nr:hypothetical protein [Actinomycetota bacterium]
MTPAASEDRSTGRTPSSPRRPSLTLWVLRHAEAASGAPPGGGDQARPLTRRGRRDATALGRRLAAGPGVFGTGAFDSDRAGSDAESVGQPDVGRGAGRFPVAMPDVVLCSPAVRTRQTAELVAASLDNVAVVPDVRLLRGGEEAALQAIREVAGTPRGVAVVGHNPTVFALTWGLLAGPEPEGSTARRQNAANQVGDDRHHLEQHGFPPCTVVALTFACSQWMALRAGTGRLAALASPPY